MNQLTALALTAMLMTAGSGAAITGVPGSATATNEAPEDGAVTDVEIDASYDAPSENEPTNDTTNARVSVSVIDEDGPVENASVELNGDSVGTTDANGSLVVEKTLEEELGADVEKGAFEGELEYRVENDSLILLSEKYEYQERESEEDEADEEEDESGDEEDGQSEEENEEQDDEREAGDDDSGAADEGGEGRGPPEDVPRGPPEDAPRGPPDDTQRGLN